MNGNCDYSKWFYLCLSLVGAVVVIALVSYGYNLKLDKKSIKLENNDKQHEHKHFQNEQRIKQLEAEVSALKKVIETRSKQEQNHSS